MNKTTEALDNILLIKFNSWIDRFIDIINEARVVEEKWLWVRYWFSLLNNFVYYTVYPILILSIYSVSVILLEKDLTIGEAVAGL